jgi:hypothetical protein
MKVSELKTEMDRKFAAVDVRFERVTSDSSRSTSGSSKSTERCRLRVLIKSEGEVTRRHFDVVVEKIVSERNLALDRSMATAEQLVGLIASNAADHIRFERRLDDRPSPREHRKGPQRRS